MNAYQIVDTDRQMDEHRHFRNCTLLYYYLTKSSASAGTTTNDRGVPVSSFGADHSI